MNKSQIALLSGAGMLLLALLFFGKTHLPSEKNTPSTNSSATHDHSADAAGLLESAHKILTPLQQKNVELIENQLKKSKTAEDSLHIFHQLARFWSDSAHIYEMQAYYLGEASKLENSEKSLTFAARLYLDNLMGSQSQPGMQHWLAENARDLFQRALIINPANDSAKIGLGACYIFGNLSENPMEGILPIREIVQKNPNNLYGQMILALGGRKSGQYDKAIERFRLILEKDPANLEAAFNLAECFELKGDKTAAVQAYESLKKMVKRPDIIQEFDNRIKELKK
ncbi:MAG: tetratricopeptide repeat protein [Chitinophagia bacterium]